MNSEMQKKYIYFKSTALRNALNHADCALGVYFKS